MSDMDHYRMYIAGKWVDSSETVEILSPTDGLPVATVAWGDVTDIDRAVAAAKDAHESGVWRERTPAERAEVIDAIADRLEERIETLTVLQVRENGATVRAAGAFLGEIVKSCGSRVVRRPRTLGCRAMVPG